MKQDAETRAQMEGLARILNWVSVGVSFLFLWHRRWYTLIGCLGCMVFALILDGLRPGYFTLLKPREENHPRRRRSRSIELLWPILLPGFAIGLTIEGTVLDSGRLFLLAGIGTAALAVGLLLIRELREDLGKLACCVVVGFMLMMAAVCQVNVLFDFDAPETSLVEVTDMRVSYRRRRADHYFCTVITPEGEVEMKISRSIYGQIEPGDSVCYHYSIGALGIPYGQISLTDG